MGTRGCCAYTASISSAKGCLTQETPCRASKQHTDSRSPVAKQSDTLLESKGKYIENVHPIVVHCSSSDSYPIVGVANVTCAQTVSCTRGGSRVHAPTFVDGQSTCAADLQWMYADMQSRSIQVPSFDMIQKSITRGIVVGTQEQGAVLLLGHKSREPYCCWGTRAGSRTVVNRPVV